MTNGTILALRYLMNEVITKFKAKSRIWSFLRFSETPPLPSRFVTTTNLVIGFVRCAAEVQASGVCSVFTDIVVNLKTPPSTGAANQIPHWSAAEKLSVATHLSDHQTI